MPILPILRYHPQVVIKKSIVHIPLNPSLTRRRCRHFPALPCQLPEFVRLHVIPWIIHRREVLLSRLHEEGAESAIIYWFHVVILNAVACYSATVYCLQHSQQQHRLGYNLQPTSLQTPLLNPQEPVLKMPQCSVVIIIQKSFVHNPSN